MTWAYGRRADIEARDADARVSDKANSKMVDLHWYGRKRDAEGQHEGDFLDLFEERDVVGEDVFDNKKVIWGSE